MTTVKVGEKPHRIRIIHPDDLVILPQMRRVVVDEELIDFARNMMAVGQLNECLVNLVTTDGKEELILMAGERRTKAIEWALEHPEEWPNTRPPFKGVRCKVYRGLTPLERFILMVSENRYSPPESREFARATHQAWILANELGIHEELGVSTLSISAFARLYGESESRVRTAIKYIQNADERVQGFVDNGDLLYTQGGIISRIPDKNEQYELARRSIVHAYSTPKIEAIVRSMLNEEPAEDQANIFNEIMEGGEEAFNEEQLSLVAYTRFNRGIALIILYLERIVRLCAEGHLSWRKIFSPPTLKNIEGIKRLLKSVLALMTKTRR